PKTFSGFQAAEKDQLIDTNSFVPAGPQRLIDDREMLMKSLHRKPPAIPLVFAKQITAGADNYIGQLDATPLQAANFKISNRPDMLLVDRTHPLLRSVCDDTMQLS